MAVPFYKKYPLFIFKILHGIRAQEKADGVSSTQISERILECDLPTYLRGRWYQRPN